MRDQFIASVLGHALGDALCAPFEGLPAEAIARDLGGAWRRLTPPPSSQVPYTDDTQTLIGVAECLIDAGEIDECKLIERFVVNYEDWRGYGQGFRQLVEAAAEGAAIESLATLVFPEGSYGNGAAMRATPIGLLFRNNLEELKCQATRSALPTHTHPLGVDGAVVFAAAIALALRDEPWNRRAFFQELEGVAETEEFQWQLRTAGRLRDDDRIPFGSSLPAQRSVVSALCCFASSPDSFLDAIIAATTLGDDTDTLAGMAGALVGARCGTKALPTAHLEHLEGRDELRRLANALADRAGCP